MTTSSEQLDLFIPTGEELRDEGMKKALDHAEQKERNWGDHAYEFLKIFCNHHYQFLTEEVRAASEGVVPEPPTSRAWGSIMVRASKEGLIKKVGYKKVSNPKAHSTPATLWEAKHNR